MKIILIPLLIIVSSTACAEKNSIEYLNFDSQSQFNGFSKDLIGALAQKSLRPSESLGLVGFDVGISYNVSSLSKKLMGQVSDKSGDSLDTVTLHAVKGLPLDLDLGLNYTFVPNSNIRAWGAELSWQIFSEKTFITNLNVKGTYTQTSDIDALEYRSYGIEAGISKSIFNFTPYASLGMVQGQVKPLEDNQINGVSLKEASTTLPKVAFGVNINLLLMDVLVAFNQVGEVPAYSLKLGYRF